MTWHDTVRYIRIWSDHRVGMKGALNARVEEDSGPDFRWAASSPTVVGHPDLRALNRRADRSRRDVEKLLQRLHPGVGCEVVSGPGTSHLEAGCYSQNGEDGVLLHILSTAGVDQRSIVEIGCGAAVECNSSALLCGFGWSGVLFDREPQQVKSARSFFEERGVSNG